MYLGVGSGLVRSCNQLLLRVLVCHGVLQTVETDSGDRPLFHHLRVAFTVWVACAPNRRKKNLFDLRTVFLRFLLYSMWWPIWCSVRMFCPNSAIAFVWKRMSVRRRQGGLKLMNKNNTWGEGVESESLICVFFTQAIHLSYHLTV